MDEALCSILCDQDHWSHELSWAFLIRFRRDGTGELCAIGDIGVFILAVNTKWKCLPRAKDLKAPATKSSRLMTSKAQLLGHLRLEIQLENSLATSVEKHFHHASNDRALAEAAFLPRTFTATIEKGNFMFEQYIGRSDGYTRYAFRMTFDISPFPAKEGYNEERGGGPILEEFEHLLNKTTTFYGRRLPDAALKVRATNDDSIMGYRTGDCVVS